MSPHPSLPRPDFDYKSAPPYIVLLDISRCVASSVVAQELEEALRLVYGPKFGQHGSPLLRRIIDGNDVTIFGADEKLSDVVATEEVLNLIETISPGEAAIGLRLEVMWDLSQ